MSRGDCEGKRGSGLAHVGSHWNGGRWRFKIREGRTGAKITKDHLEAVFIVAGHKVPETRMDDLLPLAQAAACWNSSTLAFEASILWNAEKNTWGFFRDVPPE